MFVILTSIHILAAVILILVVLLQSGSSADLAGAFGGGGSQTAFGPRGAATLLSKITTGSAIVFMITSFALAVIASKRSANSVLEGGSKPVSQQSVPASPPTQVPVGGPTSVPVATPSSGNTATPAAQPSGQTKPSYNVEFKHKDESSQPAQTGKTQAKPGEEKKK